MTTYLNSSDTEPIPKISEKIIKNTLYNTIGKFWGILVVLFLTPYIISRLGVERYGIWALITSLVGYIGFLDLGVGGSYTRYIAEYYTQKDYPKINQVINTGFLFCLGLAFVLIPLAFFLTETLLILLKLDPFTYPEIKFVFFWGVVIFSLSNATFVFGSVQSGLQRMDLTNIVAVVLTIPYALGFVIFLELGYGLRGLMIHIGIMWVIQTAANFYIAKKMLPQFSFNPFLFKKEMFSELLRFGIKLQVSRLSQLVSFQVDKLLIAYFLSVRMVTFYDLGAKITGSIRKLPLLLVSALVPASAEIFAKGDKEGLSKLYFRGSKYLFATTTPLFLFIVVCSEMLVNVWVGPGYDLAASVIRILSVGYFFNLIMRVASSVALGMGKPEFEMKYGILMSILNFSLSLILIIKFGFYGVLVATAFSLTLGSVYFFHLFHGYTKEPLRDLWLWIKKPLGGAFLASALLYLFNHLTSAIALTNHRFTGLLFVGLEFLVFLIFYFLILIKLDFWDEYDKNLLREKFPASRSLFRKT
ncbi:MAG: flippase [Candidatus Zixiibacteriota bacterium]